MQGLQRIAFATDRSLDFFTEKELTLQIGSPPANWPIVLLKELIDNALDACEKGKTTPHITIRVDPDALTVEDNGPGLPLYILEQSLDYQRTVSTNKHYVSPTRGQLGNALKCLWAAGCVINGESNVEVYANGQRHRINVKVKDIDEEIQISRESESVEWEKGTLVKIHWPGIASYLNGSNPQTFTTAHTLCWEYGLFNPHITIDGKMPQQSHPVRWITSPNVKWKKWKPNDPTSPWWYNQSEFEGLIKAYLRQEKDGGRSLTVREFIAQFAGLTNTQKQKGITDALGLTKAFLSTLAVDDTLDTDRVAALHREMQKNSKAISPAQLGIIKQEHGVTLLTNGLSLIPHTLKYKRVTGAIAENIPFSVETWFGVFQNNSQDFGRIYGLNFTPVMRFPFGISLLERLWKDNCIEYDDPVLVVIHITYPNFEIEDRGKTHLNLPIEITDAVQKAIGDVAKAWKKKQRRKRRDEKSQADDFRRNPHLNKVTLKDAAYAIMTQAYMAASDDNTLPANARQIMYAARPLVLKITGGDCWKKSSYFTQTLLPDFINDYPIFTEDWDVVYDARGNFIEPHTAKNVPIGTLKVRDYQRNWTQPDLSIDTLSVSHAVTTSGPECRYGAVLFVEKEGFNALLERGQIAERFDIALMSTKGMSVTAARALVESLTTKGVKIFVLHDFDKSGISILHTLQNNTRRYQFAQKPDVIDLGLRLSDVEEFALQEEPVEYGSKVDPRINLQKSGATEGECNFLVRERVGEKKWVGDRVELNAMTSRLFLTFIERKLEQHGVHKVVPNQQTLEHAYRRAFRLQRVQDAISQSIEDTEKLDISIPNDLEAQVRTRVNGQPHPWDIAIMDLVRDLVSDTE